MAAHAKLGPSSAERWMACPGSVALSEKCPRLPTSYAAAEGTVAHMQAEALVRGDIGPEQLMKRIGTVVQQEGHEVEIDEAMVDAAIEYRDIVYADRERLSRDKRAAPVQMLVELKVQLKSAGDSVWGTSDCVLFRKGHKLIVYDFKYGKGHVVEAAENKQLGIYALAAMDTVAGPAFDEVELVIIQPRANHVDGTERRWTAPMSWLKQFRGEVAGAVVEIHKPNARLEAGSHCRWCPAKSACPEMYGAIQKQAQADFALAPTPGSLPNVQLMPIEKLALALEWQDAIESWFEAVKDRVRDMLQSGQDVPGYKLVDGRSNRKWASEDAVIAEFGDILAGDQLYERKLLSPAKLEKIVGKGKVDHLTIRGEAPKAIAKDTDPRPVAKTSAAEDFAAIPTETVDPLAGKPKEPMWP